MNKINVSVDDRQEADFKHRMWIVTWVTLILPPVTGIFMLSFVGVFPFPEVFYPFTNYAAIVIALATILAIRINIKFTRNIIQLANTPETLAQYQSHLKKMPFYYFSLLFIYFAVGLVSTLYSLSTIYGFNYPLNKYFFSFLGIIPGGLITALPIFFYLSDTLGKYLAPRGVHISIAPIKLKIMVLGLFVPVLIDTLLIMYFYDRTGYLSVDTVGIWFFLIVIAGIGTMMAWKSFGQSMSPFVTALTADTADHANVSIVPQSLDELGLLSHQWHSMWLRVKEYEKRLTSSNDLLTSNVEERTKELESEKLFIDKVIANSGALVMILDTKGCVVRFNPACEKLTGLSFDEFNGRPIWEWLLPQIQVEEVKQVFNKLVNSGMDSQYENNLLKSDGEGVLVAWNNSTIKDQSGKVENIVAIGIDISEIQKTQIALQAAKEEAERANKAKSDFLSNMSHELRTPMNAILGFGQLLELETTLEAEHQVSVQEILLAGRHLLELINEVLDLNKIEAGKLSVDIVELDVSEIISDSLILLAPLAKEHNIKLINNTAAQNGCRLRTDRLRFKQVFINLLSNAIKYNVDNGSVSIDVSRPEVSTLRISVTDTGNGIPENMLEKLFTPFERLENARNNAVEGTGVGLALSKRLLELMGGKIGVENVTKQGSTFYMDLPAAEGSYKD